MVCKMVLTRKALNNILRDGGGIQVGSSRGLFQVCCLLLVENTSKENNWRLLIADLLGVYFPNRIFPPLSK